MPQASDAIKEQWKERVLNQSQSGLSIAAWCRQNHIVPCTFYYWRDKFLPKTSLDRADFKEIPEQSLEDKVLSQDSGISLQFHEFCIHLDRQFDSFCLKECLKILKEVSC